MIGAMAADMNVDPDAQATVTDFIDYTEYLPADMFRSVTLIEKLDSTNTLQKNRIHDLLKLYGSLPRRPTKLFEAQELRSQLSYTMEMVLSGRESAYVESSRLFDEVDRHQKRLTSVKSKLLALPKPPSRDPSPVPIQLSPQANRAKFERDMREVGTGNRTMVRQDGSRTAGQTPRQHGISHRNKPRRVAVPGEILPPVNADFEDFTDSDWESTSRSATPVPPARPGDGPRIKFVKKIHKVSKLPKMKGPKPPRLPRPPRPPGAMGTNVHSAVAGISTSNALSLLTPPPPDSQPGSRHAPWTRLTEWEMAKLRKRMKKNAIWTPSDTMIRRELAEAGRGPENYMKARTRAEEKGEDFLDFDDLANKEKGRPLVPGEISADLPGHGGSKLSNKGMKLNEMKKLKRELAQKQAAAAAAAEADQVARNLGYLGNSMKNLFNRPEVTSTSLAKSSADADKAKAAKKRKREPSAANEEAAQMLHDQLQQSAVIVSSTKATPKKRKVETAAAGNIITTTTSIPLAAAAPSPGKGSSTAGVPTSVVAMRKPAAVTAANRPRRLSIILKKPAPDLTPEPAARSTPRTASRPASQRTSVGPAAVETPISSRELQRRKSATPAATPLATTATTMLTAASERSKRAKRPAPGPVTSSQEGGVALSVGARKNAPRKRGSAAAANAAKKAATEETVRADLAEEEVYDEEEIDPDEPRYCVCGGVSYGTMVKCENDNCELEWFHLECVGLQEVPARRVKWWCPDCRLKLGKK